MSRGKLLAIGADGCPGGWIAALGREGISRKPDTELRFLGLDELLELATSAKTVKLAIDVPIGLAEQGQARACDREARKRLGGLSRSVFPAPPRALVGIEEWEDIQEQVKRWRKSTGEKQGGISKQTFGIAPKVKEVDQRLRADSALLKRVGEVHPELSFREMVGKELQPKRSPAGVFQRVAAVQRCFPDARKRITTFDEVESKARLDDVLDAYAALWSALRWCSGKGQFSMLGGELDAEGIPMRMII